jgi:hypothetical protein
MEGRVLTFKRTIMRRRLAALIACSLIAITVPLSATAEYGIPAGSGAVITAGQPLAVRSAPGWDAAVAYEIADGSYVTVWGAEQAAPDGSLWYPVDGGFVPAETVSSVAPAESGVALYQETATEEWVDPAQQGWVDPATGEWVQPAAAQDGWIDPTTGEWVQAAPAQDGWIDPATGEWVSAQPAQDGWVDPATGQWVEAQPAPAQDGWIDPATGQWVQAQPVQEGWVDPATGQWVEAAPASTGWVDPATGQWVEATPAQDGWIDPATGQWVQAAPAQEGWTDPATGQWVDPAQQGWVDPATGQWVEAAPAQQGWVDPATGQWVEAAASQTKDGWIDPATGQWVSASNEAALYQEAAPAQQGWVDPATGQWVQAAPAEQTWETGESFVVNTSTAPGMTNGAESWGEPIATAYIAGTNGEGAVCRAAPEQGTDRLAVLGEGEPVEVRGEAVGAWQPVNCAGIGGYVNTSFVAWDAPASVEFEQKARRHADRNGNRGNAGNDGNSSMSAGAGDGGHIANFAMQYVGYPYAYAGEGPYAFDCSGFTKFVIQNTLGIDITHDMFTQIGMGQSVDKGSLQAGDLVFFANTFRPGLSHAGIYVGGGQFVHAENESTGVVVSDLNSDYYGSRWAGGTRLA